MAITDNYNKIKTKEKDDLFTELFELKEQKKVIDTKIKELEKGYKPMLDGLKADLFFELSNGIRFSLKRSQRKGSIDTDRLADYGVNVDEFRKPSTDIYTLRVDT